MDEPFQLPLRDIHLPGPVSWWPLPLGWWIVIGLSVMIIGLCIRSYRRYQYKRLTAVHLAKVELTEIREQFLQNNDVKLLASEISILLRRLSISAFPRTETASLTGIAWLQHLDIALPDKPFTSGVGKILIEAPYRRNVQIDEIDPLFQLCEIWIDAVASNKARVAL